MKNKASLINVKRCKEDLMCYLLRAGLGVAGCRGARGPQEMLY